MTREYVAPIMIKDGDLYGISGSFKISKYDKSKIKTLHTKSNNIQEGINIFTTSKFGFYSDTRIIYNVVGFGTKPTVYTIVALKDSNMLLAVDNFGEIKELSIAEFIELLNEQRINVAIYSLPFIKENREVRKLHTLNGGSIIIDSFSEPEYVSKFFTESASREVEKQNDIVAEEVDNNSKTDENFENTQKIDAESKEKNLDISEEKFEDTSEQKIDVKNESEDRLVISEKTKAFLVDAYKEVIRLSHIGDVITLDKDILNSIGYELNSILESNMSSTKITGLISVLYNDGYWVKCMAIIDDNQQDVKIQVMSKPDSNDSIDDVEIELTYRKWKQERKFIG